MHRHPAPRRRAPRSGSTPSTRDPVAEADWPRRGRRVRTAVASRHRRAPPRRRGGAAPPRRAVVRPARPASAAASNAPGGAEHRGQAVERLRRQVEDAVTEAEHGPVGDRRQPQQRSRRDDQRPRRRPRARAVDAAAWPAVAARSRVRASASGSPAAPNGARKSGSTARSGEAAPGSSRPSRQGRRRSARRRSRRRPLGRTHAPPGHRGDADGEVVRCPRPPSRRRAGIPAAPTGTPQPPPCDRRGLDPAPRGAARRSCDCP